jgi:hypothetical protein
MSVWLLKVIREQVTVATTGCLPLSIEREVLPMSWWCFS